jgi:hypothetical protein
LPVIFMMFAVPIGATTCYPVLFTETNVMAGAWGCPHEADDVCTRVANRACKPGMKGCVLFRRYVIFDGDTMPDTPAETAAPSSPLADGNQPLKPQFRDE